MLCLLIAYTAQNLGDDLFISYICNRYKHIQFLIVCPKEYSATFVNIENLRLYYSYEEILHLKKDITLQILIGGSMFMQPNDLSKIEERFFLLRERFFYEIPKIVIGANFGPFQEKNHYNIYYEWFKTFESICFRDLYSFELFKSLNNTNWAPDLILSYPFPQRKQNNKDKSIIISCIYNDLRTGIPPYNQSMYTNKLIDASKEYIERGYKVILMAFCSKQGDSITAQAVLSELPEGRAKIIKYDGRINTFLFEFQSAEYIIGTRFHSVILGWKFNIPVFPIIYNSKLENVLNCYHFEGNYIRIMDFENVSFDFIDYNRKKQISIPNKKLIKQSTDHFKYLDGLVNTNHRIQV